MGQLPLNDYHTPPRLDAWALAVRWSASGASRRRMHSVGSMVNGNPTPRDPPAPLDRVVKSWQGLAMDHWHV